MPVKKRKVMVGGREGPKKEGLEVQTYEWTRAEQLENALMDGTLDEVKPTPTAKERREIRP